MVPAAIALASPKAPPRLASGPPGAARAWHPMARALRGHAAMPPNCCPAGPKFATCPEQ